MNYEFLVLQEEKNDNFFWQKLSCNCSARAAVWSYVIASYLGSNRIFKIFNSKWSYDKMLINWVRSDRTGKYLALGQELRTALRSVRTPWPRAKYFPVRSSHSVNKYILFFSQASERAGFLNPRIWLANHAHVTGQAFYDTAHRPDFFSRSTLYLNFALKS